MASILVAFKCTNCNVESVCEKAEKLSLRNSDAVHPVTYLSEELNVGSPHK